MWSQTRDRIEVVNTLQTHFEHELLDVMLEDASLREELLVVDRREQTADVAGQEIMTSDKVTTADRGS